MVLSTFPTCMQQNEQLSHRFSPTRVIWRLLNRFSFRNISRLGQAVLLIKGHPFGRAPVPAAIAISSLLLYSLTLRRGRAGRATKGALRGAAARAAGTACCARRAEPRMDIAGAVMMPVCRRPKRVVTIAEMCVCKQNALPADLSTNRMRPAHWTADSKRASGFRNRLETSPPLDSEYDLIVARQSLTSGRSPL